ncbi:MAG: putative sugar kinase YdjH [Verrucomicrobia bacterium ADurb.Bin345]|nr:MAG: putative sugar kinase YdjH [Verrucomicrobia bacterium ADurb.Bin345]
MSKKKPADVVVVGSIGIDTIKTPWEKRESILGGSASFACAAASFFAKVGMVGVVGSDFPADYRALYKKFGLDLEGLQTMEGETFRWTGVYEKNMDNRRTICTELNVFASFMPVLPPSYLDAEFIFLANISPSLQLHVLSQAKKPRFVMADTMDLWINTARDDLLKVIGRVDLLTLNESEARHLTGKSSLVKASRVLLEMGPRYVIIKKGEHGSILFSHAGMFLMPAFPLEDVKDPTGAGDSFAGGFIGALSASGRITEHAIRRAMLYGSVVASFGVEDFSLDRLATLSRKQIQQRADLLREMMRLR